MFEMQHISDALRVVQRQINTILFAVAIPNFITMIKNYDVPMNADDVLTTIGQVCGNKLNLINF